MPPRLLSLWPCWLLPLLCLLGSCQRQSVNSGEAQAEFIPQRLENSLPFATTQSRLYEFFEPGVSSQVAFIGSRAMGKEQKGYFSRFSGSFQIEDGRLVGEDNRIVIEVNSLQTEHPRLTDFLLSKNFFDAQAYPTAEFTITGLESMSLKRSFDEANQSSFRATHMIEGNLSLAGKKHGIRFPANISVLEDDDEVLLQSRFTLNRLHWGLNNPGQVGDDVINDLVVMELDIIGRTQ